MGISSNKPIQLNAAQTAQLKAAIQKYNEGVKNLIGRNIDQDDIFNLARDKDGNIIVRVDAYGLQNLDEKGGKISTTSDGHYDLTLTLSNSEFYSVDDKNAPEFKDLDGNSAQLGGYIWGHKNDKEDLALKHVVIDSDNKNVLSINNRFPDIVKTAQIGEGDDAQTVVNFEDMDQNISNLETKLKEIKKSNELNPEYLTAEEKDAMSQSTDNSAYLKGVRKEVIQELEQAVKDAKQMRTDYLADKKELAESMERRNTYMENAGFYKQQREQLLQTEDARGLNNRDWNPEDLTPQEQVKNVTQGWQEPPKADKLKDKKFSPNNSLPANFASETTQNMVKASAETAINAYNKANPNAVIDFDNVGGLSVDPKTGDILLFMNDKEIDLGESTQISADDHADYRISGFYNPKAQVINLNGNYTITQHEYSSANILKLKKALQSAVAIKDLSTTDKSANQKQIKSLTDQLRAAGVTDLSENEIKNWKL